MSISILFGCLCELEVETGYIFFKRLCTCICILWNICVVSMYTVSEGFNLGGNYSGKWNYFITLKTESWHDANFAVKVDMTALSSQWKFPKNVISPITTFRDFEIKTIGTLCYQFRQSIDSVFHLGCFLGQSKKEHLLTFHHWTTLRRRPYSGAFPAQRTSNANDHYNDIIMSAMASQITSFTIVYSTVYSGVNKENIKTPRHWPLWGEFTGRRWIADTKGQ